MNLSIVLPPILLLLACGAYIFWPQRRLATAPEKTRLDYLQERKEVIYENLRDLNFEYKAGKYPEEDFALQRSILENETAQLMSEIDHLQQA